MFFTFFEKPSIIPAAIVLGRINFPALWASNSLTMSKEFWLVHRTLCMCLIGWSYYFGIVFSTVIWKPLYDAWCNSFCYGVHIWIWSHSLGVPYFPLNQVKGPVAHFSEVPKTFGAKNPFLKLRLAHSVRLVFSYIVKGSKIKVTAKFRALRRLRFEDTKRTMSPEMCPKSFGTLEKRAPGL